MIGGRKPEIRTTSDRASRPGMSAYDRLVQMLARRDHSELEIRTKLARAQHTAEEIDSTLEMARSRKWLADETVLATREASRLALAGKSPQQIRSWLNKKGLPTEGLGAALAENEAESAYKTAAKAWAQQVRMAARQLEKQDSNRARPAQLEYLLRQRVQRLLLSRGFSSSTARSVYARLLEENPLKLGE